MFLNCQFYYPWVVYSLQSPNKGGQDCFLAVIRFHWHTSLNARCDFIQYIVVYQESRLSVQYGSFNFLDTDRQFKSWMQSRVHSPSLTYIHGHRFKSSIYKVLHSSTFSAMQCSGSFTHKKWLESLMQRSTFTFIDRQTLMSERDEVLKAWCNWRILSPLVLQLGQLSLRLLFVQQYNASAMKS